MTGSNTSLLGTEERSVAEAICLKAVGNLRYDVSDEVIKNNLISILATPEITGTAGSLPSRLLQ